MEKELYGSIYTNGLTYHQYDFRRIFSEKIASGNFNPELSVKVFGGKHVVMVDDREFEYTPNMMMAQRLISNLKDALEVKEVEEESRVLNVNGVVIARHHYSARGYDEESWDVESEYANLSGADLSDILENLQGKKVNIKITVID